MLYRKESLSPAYHSKLKRQLEADEEGQLLAVSLLECRVWPKPSRLFAGVQASLSSDSATTDGLVHIGGSLPIVLSSYPHRSQ